MKSSKKMGIAFLLNLSFALIECIFGLLFHSSVILADALHDLGDAAAIGLSVILEHISLKPEDTRYTFGYRRYSLLGALLTGIILIVGSVVVILGSIPKLFSEEVVNYDGMLLLGVIAIVVNLAASRVIHHGQSHHESMLSLHFLEDLLGWLAIIVLSLVLRVTGWYFLDPLVSIMIALFILKKSLPQCLEQIKIFLDEVPADIALSHLRRGILALDNVKAILEFHVWSTDGIAKYATVHLHVNDKQDIQRTKEEVRRVFDSQHIHKVTIECDTSLSEHNKHSRIDCCL